MQMNQWRDADCKYSTQCQHYLVEVEFYNPGLVLRKNWNGNHEPWLKFAVRHISTKRCEGYL